MSAAYTWVQWNRHKRIYDGVLLGGVALFLSAFVVIGKLVWTGDRAVSDMTLLIRAFGVCAIVMLQCILMIGPLSRLSPRFNGLLYNRRHFGVTMFVVALIHGALVTLWYHGFGDTNPIVSIFISSNDYTSFMWFPFQPLGAIALVIFFLMAATSHDFWLHNLSPLWWKTLHMLVYVAYALVVSHVALGILQDVTSPVYAFLLGLGVVTLIGLHVAAGVREHRFEATAVNSDGAWINIADVDEIPAEAGKVVVIKGCERIALFKHDNKISAMTNTCAHQGGPLGEGRVVDGCITCPWHGYQYLPHNGQSPPPFTEKIPTYEVRLEGKRVLIKPKALAPGTETVPAEIESAI